MKNLVFVTLAVASLAGSAVSINALAANDPPAGAELRMEHSAALLDAHLAGLKAGLKLTADQEKNWPAFENAVRQIAKERMDQFQAIRAERERDGARPSPIDHMRMMSERLAKGSAELKTLADAASPLYASLDDNQKRNFGPLFRDLVREGREDARHWRHAMWREHERDGDHDRPASAQ
ncbi:MAG TPA: Spy/CpxP family protein refolding chaperone [Roseiarcus sp.]|nr:Spy/CpxP family protein refolding chaperone [Roseiarcus sp.]